ncbi:MAG: hypothetical protein MH472_11630 [Bacteroidia bacterium]|nr:hypothetical protein [Bacteroidia bacterium]
MFEKEINEQLGLLQKELTRLKTITSYIDGAKENSISIIAELENVQKNYTVYTDKIFNLYKQYIDDLKKNTEIQINDGVLKFETTGNKIDTINREKLVETKRLLEQYKNIVESTDGLVKILDSVDFPNRLSIIERTQNKNNNILLQRLDQQDRELKILKSLFYVMFGLLVFGTAATIFSFNYKP